MAEVNSRNSITDYLSSFLKRGNEIAYVHTRGYRSVRTSYRQVAEWSFQFARELEARGINKDDRIILWGEDCAEWVAAFLGCAVRGVAVVPLDRTSNLDFVQRIFEQVDAKLIVASSALLSSINFTQSSIVLERLPESISAYSKAGIETSHSLDDTVEIVFTSGTTSEPKGVVISHRNILASLVPLETEIEKYRKYERPFHPIRFLNLLPLSHVFGQFLGIFIPQLIGGTVFFQDTLNPSDVIETIRRERISVCVAVPRLIDSLKEKIIRDSKTPLEPQLAAAEGEHFLRRWWRFRSIHHRFGWKFWAFISGGAALSTESEDFWRRLGYVVIQGYGMTESTSLISLNHPFQLSHHSIGKVLPGRELKLDEHGEILVRGDNIARSYWVGKQLQPVAGEEGWLHTGDLGALDENGNLYFKGRKKDVIVTPEGLNIYPEDLEAALRRQPEIRDAIVVGLTAQGNALPAAALIPTSPQVAQRELEDAVRRANESLADFQKVRRWTLWPEEDFPRTPTHKPRTNVIAQFISSQFGATANAASAASTGSLSDLISRLSHQQHQITADSRLEDDLNLSSIDRVELMSAIEDRYLVDLDDATFANATTVRDLEEMLRTHAEENKGSGTQYPYPYWQQRWPITWIRTASYYLLMRPATVLLGKPRIVGAERLRTLTGPALFISNHVTAIDIGLLMYALPPRYRTQLAVAMSGELLRAMRYPPRTMHLLRRLFEQLQYVLVVALFNVQPLPQQSNFTQSFKHLGEAADHGYSLVVFPEGKRTTTGEMNTFRSGVGLLAQRLHLPVVPMRIDGLFAFKAAGKHFAPPNAITVHIGEPLRFSPDSDPEQIARELQQRMAAL